MRVLFSTTANDGHFGPVLPFARACVMAGHQVRVAAPESYGPALARSGLTHEPFADAPPEVVGPLMARLPTMAIADADELVVREVFGRIDAQAALPALLATLKHWRPDVVVRESAELGSIAAAERFGVPHVKVCICMAEVEAHYARIVSEPLAELGRLVDLADGQLGAALDDEPVWSLVPETLDFACGDVDSAAESFRRFHEPDRTAPVPRPADWGDRSLPLVYVTFGSVTGSLPPFAGVYRQALDALGDVPASVLMTVGRNVDPESLGPLPANARVVQWLPQATILQHAAVVLGHGGFGTTMGAVAAGVPQVVAPLFTYDQLVNGNHVAAVGAGLTGGAHDPDVVVRAAAEVPRLLAGPGFAAAAQEVAAAMRELPPPSAAVASLAELAA